MSLTVSYTVSWVVLWCLAATTASKVFVGFSCSLQLLVCFLPDLLILLKPVIISRHLPQVAGNLGRTGK